MNTTQQLFDIQNKFDNNSVLSDEELNFLKKYYEGLSKAFSDGVVPRYAVFARDVYTVLDRINDILSARGINDQTTYTLCSINNTIIDNYGVYVNTDNFTGTWSEVTAEMTRLGIPLKLQSASNYTHRSMFVHENIVYALFKNNEPDPSSEF